MTTWVTITDPQTATGAIITQTLMRQYRDNMRALAEDDASVPALDTIKAIGRQNAVTCAQQFRIQGCGAGIFGVLTADEASPDTIAAWSSTKHAILCGAASNPNAAALSASMRYSNGAVSLTALIPGVSWLPFRFLANDFEWCTLGSTTPKLAISSGGNLIVGVNPGGTERIQTTGDLRLGTLLNLTASTVAKQINAYNGGDLELVCRTAGDKMNFYTGAGALALQIDGSQNVVPQAGLGTTGTFTPSLAGATTPGAQTYSTRAGRYWKLGKVVYFLVTITLTAKDAGTAGQLLVSGLPFTPISNTNESWGVTVSRMGTNWALGAAVSVFGEIPPGDSRIFLYKTAAAGEANTAPSDFTATSTLRLSGWFVTT